MKSRPGGSSRRKPKQHPVPAALSKRSPFIAVRVAANPVALRACLPNGVTLEFAQVDTDASAQLIGILAALPCSN